MRHAGFAFRHLIAGMIFLGFPGLLAAVVMTQTPDLSSLQWRHRVVLLFAPEPGNSSLAEQKRRFEADPEGLKERDIVVYEITENTPQSAALRKQFDVKPDRFAVVLVGKDSGRKMKKEEPVPLTALYGKIDAMPMRRSEMKRSDER